MHNTVFIEWLMCISNAVLSDSYMYLTIPYGQKNWLELYFVDKHHML